MLMLNVGWLTRSSRVHGFGPTTIAMRYLAASLALLVVLAAGLPASTPAAAQPPFPRGGMQQGGQVPFAVILNNIRRQFPGQLSDVQELGPRYRVKWLTPDGRVLFIDADARSGQIIGVSGGGPAPFMQRNFDRPPNVEIMRRPNMRPPPGDDDVGPAPRQPPRFNGRGRGRRGGQDDD
jgi:hypothetical protein